MKNDAPAAETAPTTTPAESDPRRRGVLRPILIGAASGVAVLALGVGGFALADALRADDDPIVITSDPTLDETEPVEWVIETDGCVVTSSDEVCYVVVVPSYESVTAAALAAVGGGTVTEVRRGDSAGDAAWKVEILLANGDTAEVRLDDRLAVIRVELDRDDD